MSELRKYFLVRFSKKTGKIDTSLEGIGKGMLKLWALQNTTKTKDTIVFDKETGEIEAYYEGTGDFPKITKGGNIEDYCIGLLEAINEQKSRPVGRWLDRQKGKDMAKHEIKELIENSTLADLYDAYEIERDPAIKELIEEELKERKQ